jgi:hypothetical protein
MDAGHGPAIYYFPRALLKLTSRGVPATDSRTSFDTLKGNALDEGGIPGVLCRGGNSACRLRHRAGIAGHDPASPAPIRE